MWFTLKTDYTDYMGLFLDGQGQLWWRLEEVLKHLEPMHLFDALPCQRLRDIIPRNRHRHFSHSELMDRMVSDREVLALFRDFNEIVHQGLLQFFQEGKVQEGVNAYVVDRIPKTRRFCPIWIPCHHMGGKRFKDVLESYKACAIQRYNPSPRIPEAVQDEPLESEVENAQNELLEADSGIEDESPSEEEDSSTENQESSGEEEIESTEEESDTMDHQTETTITNVNGNIHIHIYLHKQKQPCKDAATSTSE